jgi:hypothetical protein
MVSQLSSSMSFALPAELPKVNDNSNGIYLDEEMKDVESSTAILQDEEIPDVDMSEGNFNDDGLISSDESSLKNPFRKKKFQKISQAIEHVNEAGSQDYLNLLPPEIILALMKFLPCPALMNMAQTSTWMHKLANDNFLWKNLCYKDFDFKSNSAWEIMAKQMTVKQPQNDTCSLEKTIGIFLDQLKRKKLDDKTKENLLNLLNQAYTKGLHESIKSLLDATEQYEEFVKEPLFLTLPSGCHFKELYKIAYRSSRFISSVCITYQYRGRTLHLETPVGENGLIFYKKMQALVIFELIRRKLILESEKENAKKKLKIFNATTNLEDFDIIPKEKNHLASILQIHYETET